MKSGAPRQRQQGFVLVIVLAVLVVLALLAGSAAESSRRAVDAATAEQQRFQSELDLMSTRETTLFLLATHRRTLGGLSMSYIAPDTTLFDDEGTGALPVGNEVRLDGRPYAGLGDTVFALQDDHGLISINWSTPYMRRAWLLSLGADANELGRLEDLRLDYQDADGLRRLDGGEEREYRAAELPPPSNRVFHSPLELRRLPLWRDLLRPFDDEQLLGMVTSTRSASINLNTAPEAVLALLPGMNPGEAARLRALRQLSPLTSTYELARSFALIEPDEGLYSLFANNSGNLILWDRRFGTKRLAHWTLTTLGNTDTPWRIDYEVTLPRGNQTDQPVAGKPETPLFSATDPAGP